MLLLMTYLLLREAQTRHPIKYYFAIDMGEDGIAIIPGLDNNLANMPFYVVRQKR